MRSSLHGSATLRSAKNSLIIRALDEAVNKRKGITDLKKAVKGQSAIITTDMNPFKLFQQMKATRTMAPAKGGETATHDIEVKAGDTPFKPGPVVGDLQKVGIPAAIKEGKVVIKNDKVVVPKGEKISVDLAKMLTRLEIFPIEIGLSLHSVYENGTIFTPDILDIDMEGFRGRMRQAAANAFALALETAWGSTLTIKPLLQKAHRNALILSMEKNIVNKETVTQFISKAHGRMLSLASQVQPEALDEDLKKKINK
jgi:large subunit ribosomal protein L10